MWPPFMTTMKSAIVIASSWSCVTCTNVMPMSRWMFLSSNCISLRSFRSSAPSGSSSSSTRGTLTSARASATRCCWPPDSCRGLRPPYPVEADDAEHLLDLTLQLGAALALAAQPEGDVLEDRQVREERVALEDGVDVALVRRQSGDRAVAEVDRPRARLLEAADHAQRRRLAAARRPEQRVELAALDLEREVVDGDHVVELLRHALEANVSAHAVAVCRLVVEVQAPAVHLLRELQVRERLGRDDPGNRAHAVRQLEQVAAVDAQHLDEDVEAACGDHDVARFAPRADLVGDRLGGARRC